MEIADKHQFHYIYKVTRDDGKYYIGMHSTDDISDDYFGSGIHLLNSIKKHGKDKHTKEILEFLPTRKALKAREEEIVDEELLKDSLCMNIVTGGTGFSSEQASENNKKRWQDSEYRAKMSIKMEKRWRNLECRAKMSKALSKSLKKKWQDPEYKAMMSKVHQDPEYRAKMSKISSERLKKKWQDPEYRAKISKAHQDPERRAKMSIKMKEKWQDLEYLAKMKKRGKDTMWIKHPELKSKRIKKDEPIPAGWGKGRRMKQVAAF